MGITQINKSRLSLQIRHTYGSMCISIQKLLCNESGQNNYLSACLVSCSSAELHFWNSSNELKVETNPSIYLIMLLWIQSDTVISTICCFRFSVILIIYTLNCVTLVSKGQNTDWSISVLLPQWSKDRMKCNMHDQAEVSLKDIRYGSALAPHIKMTWDRFDTTLIHQVQTCCIKSDMVHIWAEKKTKCWVTFASSVYVALDLDSNQFNVN